MTFFGAFGRFGKLGAVGGIAAPLDYPAYLNGLAYGPETLGTKTTAQPRTTPTKYVGVDTLPSGVTATSTTVTLAGSGGTLSGWNFTDRVVVVSAAGWTIEDCSWTLSTKPGSATYALDINAGNTLVRYCSFDSVFGFGPSTAILFDGALANIEVHHCSFRGYGSDCIKDGVTLTDATKPYCHHLYFGPGSAWANDSDIDTLIANGTFPHFDAITKFAGGATYEYIYFDIRTFAIGQSRGNGTSGFPYVGWNDRPEAAISAGRSSIGLNNFFRAQKTGAIKVDQLEISKFIVRGHKRGGSAVTFQLVSDADSIVSLTDGVIEGNYTGGVLHPNNVPANYPGFSWANLLRYDDGAPYTTVGGNTATVPTAPFIAGLIGASGSNGATFALDRAPDATSHQYALSTNGGVSWGAWQTASIGSGGFVLSSLSSSTNYQVKLRGVNTNGNGAESAVFVFSTAVAPATLLVTALNGSTAYSMAASPFAETAVKQFAFLTKFKLIAAPTSARGIYGNSATNSRTAINTDRTVNLRISNTSTINIGSAEALPLTKNLTMLWTGDLTIATTDPAAASKLIILDEDDNYTVCTLTGVWANAAGSLAPNFSTTFANMRFGTADGTSILNVGLQLLAVNVGTAAVPITLPAPANKAAFKALFDDTNLLATVAGWKHAWGADYADGAGSVGAATATWNGDNGLTNRGTGGTKPMIRQAGTYTAS